MICDAYDKWNAYIVYFAWDVHKVYVALIIHVAHIVCAVHTTMHALLTYMLTVLMIIIIRLIRMPRKIIYNLLEHICI